MAGLSQGELVAAFYRAYNAGDAAAAAELYAENGWHQEGAGCSRREGRAALEEGLRRFFRMLPDASWRERERFETGGAIAVVYTMSGRLGLDLGAKPTRGLPIELPGIHVFEFEDGAIGCTRDYWSPAAFEAQLEPAPA